MPGRQVLGHVVRANWSNSTKEDRSASGKLAVFEQGLGEVFEGGWYMRLRKEIRALGEGMEVGT